MSATAPDPSIPTDLAALRAQLRAWGRAASLPDVQAAYAPWHACAPVCPHELITDVAYGPHARHRCDVYRPLAPSASPRMEEISQSGVVYEVVGESRGVGKFKPPPPDFDWA